MLHYAVVFFVIALIASLLGFGGRGGHVGTDRLDLRRHRGDLLAVAVLGGRSGRGSTSLP
jgi:hypothetical protein